MYRLLRRIDSYITAVGSAIGILVIVAVIALVLVVAEFWPLWGKWTSMETNTVTSTATSELAQSGLAMRTVSIGGANIRAYVADTDSLRERGLGGYSTIAPNEGMLFVFEHDGSYGFWMKDMNFSIDILWLSADGKVVYLQENVTSESYPTVYISQQPARYVLELTAGFVMKNNVKIGHSISMN